MAYTVKSGPTYVKQSIVTSGVQVMLASNWRGGGGGVSEPSMALTGSILSEMIKRIAEKHLPTV